MPQWTRLFAPHHLYCSVFGGAGSDILFKEPSPLEVYNDLDGDLHVLFQVLRDDHEALIRRLENTSSRSRRTYEEAVVTLQSEAASSLDRAWAFLVIANQGYRSKHPRLQTVSSYAGLRKNDRCISHWLDLPETLRLTRERLLYVQQERLDFRKLIPKYDTPDTFFFVDPPYHLEVRNGHRYYVHEMDAADHEELLGLLNQVKGKVFLCGYDHPVYQHNLRHWTRREFQTHSPHSSRAARTEVVWMNYDPPSNGNDAVPADPSIERYSPPWIVEGARAVMGDIDLDPASCELANETVKARRFHDIESNGLRWKWRGRVFLNPPFGPEWRKWITKLYHEIEAGRVQQAVVVGQGNVLWAMNKQWFQPLLQGAVLLPSKPAQFFDPFTESWHSPRFGCFVCYLGPYSHRFAKVFGDQGVVLRGTVK